MTIGTRRLAEALQLHPGCGVPAEISEEALAAWADLLLSNLAARRIIQAVARFQDSGAHEYFDAACDDLAELVEAEIHDAAPRDIH